QAFDPSTGKYQRTYKGISRAPNSVAMSPDLKYLVGGGYDGDLILWDAKTAQHLQQITRTGSENPKPHWITWSCDSRCFAVSRVQRDEKPMTLDHRVEVYHMIDGKAQLVCKFAEPEHPGSLWFVP